MAYMIVADQCTGCCACEPECPNKAISALKSIFVIAPDKCTECVGHHDEPQCVAVCPIDDTCVIDETWPRQEAA